MPQVINLKLGACLTAPTKRNRTDLAEVATELNLARNAAVRHFVRWREDHPDWQGKGKRLIENENEMYHAARAAAPNVNSKIVSSACQDVRKYLTGNVPYDHTGSARWRWQAILRFEINACSFRSQCIPAPCQDSVFCYGGDVTRELSRNVHERIAGCGSDSAVVRFPLYSREAGRSVVDAVCRVEVRQLSRGNRKLLKRIARGEVRMCDSKVVLSRRGDWEFQLVYAAEGAVQVCDPLRIATLVPGMDSPFALMLPGGEKPIGRGWILENERKQVVGRRRAMQHRSRHGAGSGHGKAHFFGKVRPLSRRWNDFADTWAKEVAAHVIDRCIADDCGTLLYREPTKPVREVTWFSKHGIPFDWTRFASVLTNAASKSGVVFPSPNTKDNKRLTMAEWRERA